MKWVAVLLVVVLVAVDGLSETSQQGGTSVHRKYQSSSDEKNEESQQSSSQSSSNDQGPHNRGSGHQGLSNNGNQDESEQYNVKRTDRLRHKPISHLTSHGTSEKVVYHQNGNFESQTGNHDGSSGHIGHLVSYSGGHVNGNHGQNSKQILRGAGHQRTNHIVKGTGIQQQGADYNIHHNHDIDTSKMLTGSGHQGTDETVSEVLKRGLNKPHYIGGSGNQGINSGKYGYVSRIPTLADNIKYVSRTGYNYNSNGHLNGLFNRMRGAVNYPVSANQEPIAGMYINRDVVQDENEETNSQYMRDILIQAQHLLKHGAVPNDYGNTPAHYHHVPSNRGPVYGTTSGIRFYDAATGSYMTSPSFSADGDNSYGEIAPELVIPIGIDPGFNIYANEDSSGPSYYRNGGFGTGLRYIPSTDATGPTTIFGRSPDFNHVGPVNTIPVNNVANEDNTGGFIEKTLTFAPLKPLTLLTPLSLLTPIDNDYEGTSRDISDIIKDTDLISKRDTNAPGSDGTIKKVGTTTVFNKHYKGKNSHAHHPDSDNSGTRTNIHEAIIDKTVLRKHTEKYGKDNGKIDKTTKIIGNYDKSDVTGNGPKKPDKSIITDKSPGDKNTDKDSKDGDKKDKTVEDIRERSEIAHGSDNDVVNDDKTNKYGKSFVIVKTTDIIKTSGKGDLPGSDKNKGTIGTDKPLGDKNTDKDSKDGDKKDKTVEDITEPSGIAHGSDNDVVNDDKTTKYGKPIVTEYKTEINKTSGNDYGSDSNDNKKTVVTNKLLGDKNTDKDSKDGDKKDKTVEDIRERSEIAHGSDNDVVNDDKTNKYGKSFVIVKTTDIIKTSGKGDLQDSKTSGKGDLPGSDKNKETIMTDKPLGDKNTDKDSKDGDKKDKTVEDITEPSGIAHGSDNDVVINDDKTTKYGKPIVTENTTEINKTSGKGDLPGSDKNKGTIGTDKPLGDKNTDKDSKDGDKKDKTVEDITEPSGIAHGSDNDVVINDDKTTKYGKPIVTENTTEINKTSGKGDLPGSDKNKGTIGTDKPLGDKNTDKDSKDGDKKDKTVEDITEPSGIAHGSDNDVVNDDKTTKYGKPIVTEYKTEINKTSVNDYGSDSNDNKKTVVTNKLLGDKNTDKDSKDGDKKDQTVEDIRERSEIAHGSDNDVVNDDKTNKYGKSFVIVKTTDIIKTSGKGDLQDSKTSGKGDLPGSDKNKETIMTDKPLGDKNTDKDSKDGDKKDKTVEDITEPSGIAHGSDNDVVINDDKTTKYGKPIVTENTTEINKTSGKGDLPGSDKNKGTIGTDKPLGDKNTDKDSKDGDKKDKTVEDITEPSGIAHGSDNDVVINDDKTTKYGKPIVTENTTEINKTSGKGDLPGSDKNKGTIGTDKPLGDKNTDKDSKDGDKKDKTVEDITEPSGIAHGSDNDVVNDDKTTKYGKPIVTEYKTEINKTSVNDYGSDSNDNKKTVVTNKLLGDKNTDKDSKDGDKKDKTVEDIRERSEIAHGSDNDVVNDDKTNKYGKPFVIVKTTDIIKTSGKGDLQDSKTSGKGDLPGSDKNKETIMTDKPLGDKNTDKDSKDGDKKDKTVEDITEPSGIAHGSDNDVVINDDKTTKYGKPIVTENTTEINKTSGKGDLPGSDKNKGTIGTDKPLGDKNTDKDSKDGDKKDKTVEDITEPSGIAHGSDNDVVNDDKTTKYGKPIVTEYKTEINKTSGNDYGSDSNDNKKTVVTNKLLGDKNTDKDSKDGDKKDKTVEDIRERSEIAHGSDNDVVNDDKTNKYGKSFVIVKTTDIIKTSGKGDLQDSKTSGKGDLPGSDKNKETIMTDKPLGDKNTDKDSKDGDKKDKTVEDITEPSGIAHGSDNDVVINDDKTTKYGKPIVTENTTEINKTSGKGDLPGSDKNKGTIGTDKPLGDKNTDKDSKDGDKKDKTVEDITEPSGIAHGSDNDVVINDDKTTKYGKPIVTENTTEINKTSGKGDLPGSDKNKGTIGTDKPLGDKNTDKDSKDGDKKDKTVEDITEPSGIAHGSDNDVVNDDKTTKYGKPIVTEYKTEINKTSVNDYGSDSNDNKKTVVTNKLLGDKNTDKDSKDGDKKDKTVEDIRERSEIAHGSDNDVVNDDKTNKYGKSFVIVKTTDIIKTSGKGDLQDSKTSGKGDLPGSDKNKETIMTDKPLGDKNTDKDSKDGDKKDKTVEDITEPSGIAHGSDNDVVINDDKTTKYGKPIVTENTTEINKTSGKGDLPGSDKNKGTIGTDKPLGDKNTDKDSKDGDKKDKTVEDITEPSGIAHGSDNDVVNDDKTTKYGKPIVTEYKTEINKTSVNDYGSDSNDNKKTVVTNKLLGDKNTDKDSKDGDKKDKTVEDIRERSEIAHGSDNDVVNDDKTNKYGKSFVIVKTTDIIKTSGKGDLQDSKTSGKGDLPGSDKNKETIMTDKPLGDKNTDKDSKDGDKKDKTVEDITEPSGIAHGSDNDVVINDDKTTKYGKPIVTENTTEINKTSGKGDLPGSDKNKGTIGTDKPLGDKNTDKDSKDGDKKDKTVEDITEPSGIAHGSDNDVVNDDKTTKYGKPIVTEYKTEINKTSGNDYGSDSNDNKKTVVTNKLLGDKNTDKDSKDGDKKDKTVEDIRERSEIAHGSDNDVVNDDKTNKYGKSFVIVKTTDIIKTSGKGDLQDSKTSGKGDLPGSDKNKETIMTDKPLGNKNTDKDSKDGDKKDKTVEDITEPSGIAHGSDNDVVINDDKTTKYGKPIVTENTTEINKTSGKGDLPGSDKNKETIMTDKPLGDKNTDKDSKDGDKKDKTVEDITEPSGIAHGSDNDVVNDDKTTKYGKPIVTEYKTEINKTSGNDYGSDSNDNKKTVVTNNPLGDKNTDEDSIDNGQKYNSVEKIKKDLGTDDRSDGNNNKENGENEDSDGDDEGKGVKPRGNSGKKDKKYIESENGDASCNEATGKGCRSGKGKKSGSNDEETDETVRKTKRGRSNKDKSALITKTFRTIHHRKIHRVGKKDAAKSKKHLETKNVSRSGLELSHNNDSESSDDLKSAITNTSNTTTKTSSTSTDNSFKTSNSKKSELANMTIKIIKHKTKINEDANNNNLAGRSATADSGKSTKTDDGKTQDNNNVGIANNSGFENYDEGESGGSSTNGIDKATSGSPSNDNTKSNVSTKREVHSSQSATEHELGSEEESLKTKGNKSTYSKRSNANEQSERQNDSKFTEETQGPEGKSVQTEQRSASQQANQSSSDKYTNETDGKNRKSKKESSNSDDQKKQEAFRSESKKVDLNGNMEESKSSSFRKFVKSSKFSSTNEEMINHS